MNAVIKRFGHVALAIVFAIGVAVPTLMFTEATPAKAEEAQVEEAVQPEAPDGEGVAAQGDCVATIQYLENAPEDAPDQDLDETGRHILGTRTITGLKAGDVLKAWDYVEDIPGHFFFDGWPSELTVTENPADNVIKLIYFNTNDSEYTVNYYVMTGADLTADTWAGALSTGDVHFDKLGSQTFEDQRFNMLVNGAAYEYKLDGMYVIDTYPSQIRLGVDPDENVINVLYAGGLDNLPSDTPVSEDQVADVEDPTVPSRPEVMPPDGAYTEDEISSMLPDDASAELVEDFVGNTTQVGSELVQTGDPAAEAAAALAAVAAAAMIIMVLAFFVRKRA
ncbi:MAG: hypothetical protein HFJ65_07945 [Eggerthellaceae bacterium]|nr:hypothetical protein [Eggerthellaceae bacterium]